MKIYTPHPLLQHLVSCYRIIYFGNDPVFRQPWVVSPTGSNTLAILVSPASVVDIGRKEKHSARIRFSGQTDEVKYFTSEAIVNSEILVELKPGAAFELFGIPQNNFTNKWIEVDDFLPDTAIFYNQLDDCGLDIDSMIPIVDSWLLQMAVRSKNKPKTEILMAMQHIMTSSGQMDIVQLRNKVGMTRASFQNHFKQQIGVSPKTYSRIVRANAAYKEIQQIKDVDWQQVTHDLRYFDQSHFIKDFKHFFGCTPSDLHRGGFYLSQFLYKPDDY